MWFCKPASGKAKTMETPWSLAQLPGLARGDGLRDGGLGRQAGTCVSGVMGSMRSSGCRLEAHRPLCAGIHPRDP